MKHLNRNWRLICLSTLVLALVACAGRTVIQAPPEESGPPVTNTARITLEALYGSSAAGVNYKQSAHTVVVSFTAVPATGQFVRLTPPAGTYFATDPQWDSTTAGRQDVLPLALAADGGLELSVVPLSSFEGGCLALTLDLLNEAPLEAIDNNNAAQAEGLSLVDLGDGKVELSWVECCAGDYNFDGSVDARDVLPIAECLGQTYDLRRSDLSSDRLYWLDGDGDGTITVLDLQCIVDNYKASIAGFVVSHNDKLIRGEGDGELELTVAHDRGRARPGLPAQYSLEIAGATTDSWSIAAVDAAGNPGDAISISYQPADLAVQVTVTGLELFAIENLVPGYSEPVKIGSRVIDPIETIGQPVVANAVIVGENQFAFVEVPRDHQLLLDVQYLPVTDLTTGQAVELPSDQITADLLASLISSAIPFELAADAAGTTEMDIDISFMPLESGGYSIDVFSETRTPDGYASALHTSLDYPESLVKLDLDLDGDFGEEWQLYDEDRNGLSSTWEDEELLLSYLAEGRPCDVIANIDSVDQAQGQIVITNIAGLDPYQAVPPGADALTVWVHEFTAIDPGIDPWHPDPATRYLLNLMVYEDDEAGTFINFADIIEIYHEPDHDPNPGDPTHSWPLEGTVVAVGDYSLALESGAETIVVTYTDSTVFESGNGFVDASAIAVGDYVHVQVYLIYDRWLANWVFLLDEPVDPWTDPGGAWPLDGLITAIGDGCITIEYEGLPVQVYCDETTDIFVDPIEGDGALSDLAVGDWVHCDAQNTAAGMWALVIIKLAAD
ncbi:hypothetical protein JW859_13980 [bacterium]|nr:hypothetical protein [bacterium]